MSTSTEERKTPTKTGSNELSVLHTSQGKTVIADGVVQKIASMAAREVTGVHKLGGAATRTLGALRERIPGSSGPSLAAGVSVEVGERQAAIDLTLVIEYGVSIVDCSTAVRKNVVTTLQQMTGLEVTEVNISIDDLYIPGEEPEEKPEVQRVQ